MPEETRSERDSRCEKLTRLRQQGVHVYAYNWSRTHTAAEAVAGFDELAAAKTEVRVAGRLLSRRKHGKTQFGHLQDASGRIQLYLRRDVLGDDAYERLSLLDVGDIVGVRGEVFRTKTGEITVNCRELTLLAKSLAPLPEKFHGLKDVELRYRQRYLDLIANPEVRDVFRSRARIVRTIRRFLDERGFVEVETPTLQPLYGGAAAEPFRTRYNVLDQEVYLRISDELYLKRLIVGGMERVYEICKDFRNEGLDRLHNPEFTQVELYQAYADYRDMMTLVESLFGVLAEELNGTTEVTFAGKSADLGKPWRRLSFVAALAEKIGADPLGIPEPQLREVAERHGIEASATATQAKLLDRLFEELVQDHIVEPTFVMDHPKITCPLAKTHRENPELVERFEPVVCGMELGNAFSELNDPLEQRRRFEEQIARHEEYATLDEDYCTALEYGMPPTGGLGLGVDRLVMLLTGQSTIREVILFPQLRQAQG